MMALYLWLAALLLVGLPGGHATEEALGPAGLIAAISSPSGGSSVTVQHSTVCQQVTAPTNGFVATLIGAYGAADGFGIAREYVLSLYGGTQLLSQNRSIWQSGALNLLQLPGQSLLMDEEAFVCLTSLNATAIALATETGTAPQLTLSGIALPSTLTTTATDGPALALYLVGMTPGVVTTHSYLETFDSWPLCDPNGCSMQSGPCAAQDGWVNPPDDDFDWSVQSGPTATHLLNRSTGPSEDHTLGTSSGHYVYGEASIPCGASTGSRRNVALLRSPVLSVGRGWYLKIQFWMHMWGQGLSDLHIDVSWDRGATFTLDVVPFLSGNKGNEWIQYDYDISRLTFDSPGNEGAVVQFRFVTGNTSEVSFEGDVAIDDVNITFSTMTPTPTSSTTLTPSSTRTLTPLPTYTSTPTMVPTSTPSATATATPMRQHKPIGIPDPPSIVNAAWASVSPRKIVVSELSVLQLTGAWLYRKETQVDVKFAVWHANCLDLAPGSAIVALDEYNVAHIPAPSSAGQYMLCLRHRQDWEQVAVIDVEPQNVSVVVHGYSTCEQFLRFNPTYCGCWLQRGDLTVDAPAVYTLPTTEPHWQLLQGSGDVLYEQGCCVRSTKARLEGADTGVAYRWGMCVDHNARGQLGDFGCSADPGLQ
eukprot:GGOE01062162.1.p1 GENE.GGOE01062162.1~~GGOE01062162.1.p1  ORF type:complete len:647 (+),score=173.06 GGOE01062162.1:21-1961(+)